MVRALLLKPAAAAVGNLTSPLLQGADGPGVPDRAAHHGQGVLARRRLCSSLHPALLLHGCARCLFLSCFLFAVSSSWACLLLQRMLQPALRVHGGA